MKRVSLLLAAMVMAAAVHAADTKPAPKAAAPAEKKAPSAQDVPVPPRPEASAEKPASPFATPKERSSYAVGFNIGSSMKAQELDVDMEILFRGIRDGRTGAKAVMSEEDMKAAFMAMQQEMMAKAQKRFQEQADKNRLAGEEFLKKNATEAGVKVTESGLQYKVLTEGAGELPKPTDTVMVHYKGSTIDGNEFDSSYKRNEPTPLRIESMIPGMAEALKMMKVGSKWKIVLPANLAYGEQGAGGGVIGPNSAIIFEVEVLSIKKDEAPKPAEPAAAPETK